MSSGERKRKRLNQEQQCSWGLGQRLALNEIRRNVWESIPKNVRVVYSKIEFSELDPEYRGTRGIPWEDRGTTL